MELTARSVMEPRFGTVQPQMRIGEAMQVFQQAGKEQGQPVFGMIVADEAGRLVGMLSLYDVLLLLRPKHIHIWGEISDLEINGVLDAACRRARSIQVGDIMTTEVVTVTPETNLLVVIDIMIKKHIRRIPVVEKGSILGIVYLSRVFQRLLDRLQD